MSQAARGHMRGQIDFAIITVRADEFQAVLDRFPGEELLEGARPYRVSQVHAQGGRTYQVAVARCTEQGTGEAQDMARDIIDDLDPAWILVVGIAGGVPDNEYTLGDVILGTRVNDLTVRAVYESGPPKHAIAGGPGHRTVTNLVTFLPALHTRLGNWNTADAIRMTRPALNPETARMYGDNHWQQKIRDNLATFFAPDQPYRKPEFRDGPVDSSDTLVKDTATLKQWLALTRNSVAVDMESAGVYRAARRSGKEYPFLPIRALSDLVGLERDPKWTTYACHTAAAFTLAFIKAGLIEPRTEKTTQDAALHRSGGTESSCAAERHPCTSSLRITDAVRLVPKTGDGMGYDITVHNGSHEDAHVRATRLAGEVSVQKMGAASAANRLVFRVTLRSASIVGGATVEQRQSLQGVVYDEDDVSWGAVCTGHYESDDSTARGHQLWRYAFEVPTHAVIPAHQRATIRILFQRRGKRPIVIERYGRESSSYLGAYIKNEHHIGIILDDGQAIETNIDDEFLKFIANWIDVWGHLRALPLGILADVRSLFSKRGAHL